MNIYENFQLSEILYYQIGGKARYVLKIQNMDDVTKALDFIQEKQITNVLPVGIGANLLMTEDFFDGAILWFAKPEEEMIHTTDEGLIEAFAGHLLDDVIRFSFSNSFIGLEWAGGLPSTVGGAIRGNVGAFGSEIKKVVEKVEVLDISNGKRDRTILSNEALEFSYRSSLIKKQPHLIVLRAFFRLTPADEQTIANAQNIYFAKIEHRKKYNPVEYPSCGSTFKNITEPENVKKMLEVWPDMQEMVDTTWHHKVSMGYTIRRLGLSGFTIGRGQVSEKHSNYLINLGGAHFSDIYELLEKVKSTFKETFGFFPEPEVQVIQ